MLKLLYLSVCPSVSSLCLQAVPILIGRKAFDKVRKRRKVLYDYVFQFDKLPWRNFRHYASICLEGLEGGGTGTSRLITDLCDRLILMLTCRTCALSGWDYRYKAGIQNSRVRCFGGCGRHRSVTHLGDIDLEDERMFALHRRCAQLWTLHLGHYHQYYSTEVPLETEIFTIVVLLKGQYTSYEG
jgi:hypothetical protein